MSSGETIGSVLSETPEPAETDIAITGMAGRFPGAADVDELWRRIAAGEDCLADLDRSELLAAGVPQATIDSPEYVLRGGWLDDVAGFDHRFFGIGARDAAVMDPQHRHFLECCWEALEAAAVVPERFAGAIGVFGGCGMNSYLINNLLTNGKVLPQLGWFLLRHTGNDKDFLTNNVAYRLNLHGPAVNVQTACSTSLVAVHLAVQSLLSFETDLAVAGGVTIDVPHGRGYQYHEGEILAPDGVCRAFDAQSGGTVLTSGVAVVALRRLGDALSDGDPILAVIKGSACNNDGSRKVGFLAPSVDGHADVIREALTVAGISAREIQLFEAHGTGTAVGDPIELAAASAAYGTWTGDSGFCRVTSTKPNVGHLDTAAGTTSLIKVVQALRHHTLPPMANHTAASTLIDLERSPFHLAATADPWPDDSPRRAGISSLGVGGTNVHVVVEEAPQLTSGSPAAPEQVLAISALSSEALDAAGVRLARHLDADPEANLADVAYTLVTGRRAMPHRRVVTATDVESAVRVLGDNDRYRSARAEVPEGPVRLGFMFPGGGSQYVGMAAGLDERFATFHAVRAEGIELVQQYGGADLAALLAPGGDPAALRLPTASIPSVFVTSVALARQWLEFGARPDVLIGHSLGEYVAAHLAGVMSFEDAIAVVVGRSVLLERAAEGGAAMLAVPMAEAELVEILPETLSLAAVNADGECAVAGRAADIQHLATILEQREVPATVIPISAAGHSAMLDPVLDELTDLFRTITLNAPQLPYPTNLTGTWITEDQATSAEHWTAHTRGTVRFADCVRTAVGDSSLVLTELGPGQALSSYARRSNPRPLAVIPTLRHHEHEIDDTAFTLQAFARQWASGVDVDLARFAGDGRRRWRLPTYPFQHQHCWIEPGHVTLAGGAAGDSSVDSNPDRRPERIDDLDRATWTVPWVTTDPPTQAPQTGFWVILGDEGDELVSALASELGRRDVSASVLAEGAKLDAGAGVAGVAVIAPAGGDHYDLAVRRWFTDATAAIVTLGSAAAPVRLVVVTRTALAVAGPADRPADAMAIGVALVSQREYPDLTSRVIDVDRSASIAAIVDDVLGDGPHIVAHRDGQRSTPRPEPTTIERPSESAVTFRDGGTYLVTGGLGGVGHVLARHLAIRHRANLVLVSSADVPAGDERERWLASHAYDDPTARRIRKLAELEALGTKVAVVVADLADPAAVRRALAEAERKVGHLDGAVHAAGQLRDRLIEFATNADHDVVLGAKARGALVLAEELERRDAHLLLLVSSTSTALAPQGQASYVAANAVLDALAGRRGTLRVATMNFGLWADVGIASDVARRVRLGISDGEPVDHPIFSERYRDSRGATSLIGRVDADQHWVVGEHRTADGTAVYPGTGHVHLMLSAARLAGLDDVQLVDVVLLSPLVVPDGRPVTVRALVSADGVIEISGDGGGGRRWMLHSQAATEPAASDRDVDGDPLADLHTLQVDDSDLLSAQRAHVAFGPRWNAVVETRRGDGVIVARLALPGESAEESTRWSPHPALVDVATATGIALAPPDAEQRLYVPTGYQRVRVVAPVPSEIVVRAVVLAGSTAERLRVDLVAVDLAGNLVFDIRRLELLGSAGHSVLERIDQSEPGPAHRATTLAEWADELGLRPSEGTELVERLLASDHDRLIGSTIGIEDLLRRLEEGASEPAAGVDSAAAAGSLDRALTTIWSDLLGVDEVGPDDDFFDLGGHSLIAIRLMTRIHSELGIRLQLTTIFDAPTIATLAARLREENPDLDAVFAASSEAGPVALQAQARPGAAADSRSPMSRHLVPISTRGEGRPLYIVHGAGGNILFLARLARALAATRPVFGFQAHGIEGEDAPDGDVDAMAARYVAELRAHAPGPYLLGGYSGGGVVALEMARLLQAAGERVDCVVLFDSPTGRISLGRWVHARYLIRNLFLRGFRPIAPIVHSRVQGTRLGRYLLFRGHKSEHQVSHELNYEEMLDHGFNDLFDHFSAVAEAHQVGTYSVDAILVKCQLRWPMMSDDYGWGPHIDGRLDICVTPGDHESMFHGGNVDALVTAFAPLLDRYDATPPS